MKYPKIQTVFKRDKRTNYKTLTGIFAKPEFSYLRDNEWTWTEKVDGMNIRLIVDCNGTCTIKGRTDVAIIPRQLENSLQKVMERGNFAKVLPLGAILYGEGYGPKIQKGGKYASTQEFVLFDIKIGSWWLGREVLEALAQDLGFMTVPIVGTGTLEEMVSFVRENFPSRWGNFEAEGVVATPSMNLKDYKGDRIITKLKTGDFK